MIAVWRVRVVGKGRDREPVLLFCHPQTGRVIDSLLMRRDGAGWFAFFDWAEGAPVERRG